MCKNLRKVIFRKEDYFFDPDATLEEDEDMDELCRERRGYFHRWVEDVDSSREMPCIKVFGLVEDAETGELYFAEIHNIRFTLDWQ